MWVCFVISSYIIKIIQFMVVNLALVSLSPHLSQPGCDGMFTKSCFWEAEITAVFTVKSKPSRYYDWWDKNSCFSLLMFDYHTGLLKRQFLKFHSFSPMRYESRIENPLCFKEQCPRLFGYCSVPSNFSMTPTDIHTFIILTSLSSLTLFHCEHNVWQTRGLGQRITGLLEKQMA